MKNRQLLLSEIAANSDRFGQSYKVKTIPISPVMIYKQGSRDPFLLDLSSEISDNGEEKLQVMRSHELRRRWLCKKMFMEVAMRRILVGVFFVIMLFWPLLAKTDEREEPAQRFTLVIDGREIPLQLNQEIMLEQKLNNPRIILHASSARHFDLAGIAFDYPAAFVWEADIENSANKNWTLSGNDFKIMVFLTKYKMSAEEQTRSMRDRFDAKAQIRDCSHTFNGRVYGGKQARLNFKGTTLLQEAFELPSKQGNCLLVFQIFSGDDKTVNAERELTMNLLRQTFTVK